MTKKKKPNPGRLIIQENEFPISKTLVQLFEDQVIKTPNNTAIIYDNCKLTYNELNEQANQLANYIIDNYTIKPDDLIALVLDRSERMLIAILAVLKAGAAYVPIEPSYPDDRISYILHDTKARLVLVSENYKNKLNLLINNHVKLLEIDKHSFVPFSISNPHTSLKAHNLAYVIYTSGTTGTPKGVMIEHRSVINFIYDLINRYKLNKKVGKEVILQFTNYVFDPSVEQVWLALLNGYKLLLIPDKLWLDVDKFYNYLSTHMVTHIHATPTFLSNYDFSRVLSLKRLVSGGELLTESCYKKLQYNNKIQIINKYGPTEATVDCLANVICNNDIRVGEPMANVKIYVLNDKLTPVAEGQPGELYIGGAGLARGYLNLPELTTEKFIANPFQTEEERALNINARIYKTGDRFKWCADGKLEYIGRKDFQVKLGGYRIELAEIEALINKYPTIMQSVILVHEMPNKHKCLIGYYISASDIDSREILDYLRNKLPSHMIPVLLNRLDKMPVTINGKLDRKALLEINKSFNGMQILNINNQINTIIFDIWGKLLGINPQNVQDNFFHLGPLSSKLQKFFISLS